MAGGGVPTLSGIVARAIAALLSGLLVFGVSHSAVQDRQAVDVTPVAFSVVWVSDEPVTASTIRVFADGSGTTELTGGLAVSTPSAAVSGAHALGLVRADVQGLAANTCYYFQTETTGATLVFDPPAPPFPQVCTTQAARRANGSAEPIVNDLILHDVYAVDGVTPVAGALVVAALPGLSHAPVSAFVRTQGGTDRALIDLNNVFDSVSGESADLDGGEILQVTEYLGLSCGGQSRVRMRVLPTHDETPVFGFPISEVEFGVACFFADTNCDDTVDVLDAQRLLGIFGSQSGDCEFNVDLDVVADQTINILDVQSVLNRLGENAPFVP